ncbi:CehA/McbA family metallohydrolase [Hymenobacter antarcticus]|uniref:CehA/McbA family metallohydrolase n=1 Tax=Hymenobacter antarcticus TaxID=486270 RepID=UPI0031E59F31
MLKNFTLLRTALTLLTGFATLAARAQGVVLLDDFNRANNATVGNGWTETETGGTGSASITSNQLRLSSGTAGRDFVVRDLSARYNPVLSSNRTRLTWAWNTRQSRPDPSGFGASNYGNAFVLAASAPGLASAGTSGYAVVVGNTGATDPIRLVRFSGGLTSSAALVDVFSTTTDYGTAYLTLRVSYFPDDNSWTLEASPNTAAFEDPGLATTAFTTLGTGVDATYTGTPLPYLGCLWNHATTAAENAVFDNIYIPAACAVGPEPGTSPSGPVVDQLTASSARLSLVGGDGTARLVVLRAGAAPGFAPVDGTAYAANPDVGAGTTVAAGEYVVLNGPGPSASLTGLQPSTTYFYATYESNGTGCAANYRQAGPLTGSFATPACQPAAPPTVPASQGTAAAGPTSGTLTFGWTAGDGTRRVVVVRPAQAVAATPADGLDYAASARYGAGTALSTDEYVVYSGTGSSVTVSGLSVGQTYHAAVYEGTGSACAASYRRATPATASVVVAAPPASTTYRFYRGNLHAHSGYSDGNKDAATSGASTPADDYALGRLAQQFDFLGISEHNHAQAGMSLPNYAQGVAQATQSNQDGTFVALYGMEWGTISGGGHVIVYGYDRLIGWEAGNYDVFVAKGDYTALFATVAQQPGAVAYLAHPQSADYNNLLNSPLNATTAQALVGSAMRSGPAFSTATDYSDPSASNFEARYKDALRQGYHVGPTMDQDTHYSVFGRSSYARLVLQAPALTKAALLDALQQRRFSASDDYNVEVTLQVGTRPMGSVLTQAGAPTLTVAVTDPDANDAVASIALFAGIPGSGTAATQVTSTTGSATLTYTDPIPNLATYYYYAVVTQTDGNKIWTAPIRYTRDNAQVAPLPVTLTTFQAVLHNAHDAVLRWTTASEEHSAYFAVERSADGRAFAETGRVAAAGRSTQARAYQLADPQPLTGGTYYRLRQVDTDGTTTFSPVVTLSPARQEAAQVSVFPNPTVGHGPVQVALRGLAGRPVTVTVRDLLGRTLLTQHLVPAAYQAVAPLPLAPELPSGVYLVTVTDGSQTWTSRWSREP